MVLSVTYKSTGSLLFALFNTGFVAAGPHGHRHLHIRGNNLAVQTDVVTVPVKVFEYNGQLIPEGEVCQGIENGTLHWAPGSVDMPQCAGLESFSAAVTLAAASSTAKLESDAPVVTITHTVTSAAVTVTGGSSQPLEGSSQSQTSSSSFAHTSADTTIVSPDGTTLDPSSSADDLPFPAPASVSPTSSDKVSVTPSFEDSLPFAAPSDPPTSTVVASEPASPSLGTDSNVFIQTNANVGVEFPDGQLDCSVFPESYGAINIPWMNLGGWSGIQYASFSDNQVTDLTTATQGTQCAESQDGSATFCSYACPPGYQKSQWPAVQGGASMAVSVGGLMCSNGKLHLTNPSLSTSLCIPGTGKSFVANALDGSASICRTDYPGTEDETVPLQTQSGVSYPLTCPDAGTYYQHLGDLTSAQYYVNNKNVPVTSACQWNTDGSNEGNFAPVVIGAETDSSGATWLSIMTSRQNDPINYQELDYSIELVGDFGGSACFYTQSEGVGYYCSSGSLANFDPNQEGCKTFDPSAGVTVPGCTVQLFSGTATYHLVETA